MSSYDLTAHKVVALVDVEAAVKAGATAVVVRADAILTPSARDYIGEKGIALQSGTSAPASAPAGASGCARKSAYGNAAACASGANSEWDALFHSPEAERIKAEIVATGRKLWQRMYVDGNGGNISYRLNEQTVICTPTLVSKADLTPEDLCLVDMSGNQLAGGRPRTSEVLMHLEIYKAVPEAKAAVHCHPPHATAYAITGRVPPTCIIPEFEVFVGKVALTQYETPGTQKFAETVIPWVKNHNTVLLGNHGIVCWADTVTHAEWYAEVLDTYCWTLMLAAQIGAPITTIPARKATDLLAIKQKLGLPDQRFSGDACEICDMPELGSPISVPPPVAPGASGNEVEELVEAVTAAVLARLNAGKLPS
jgi:L-fuculose-phosphate aldolase